MFDDVASPARADDRGARAVCAAGESEWKIALSSAEPACYLAAVTGNIRCSYFVPGNMA